VDASINQAIKTLKIQMKKLTIDVKVVILTYARNAVRLFALSKQKLMLQKLTKIC
jgi:hypothetical protein